MPLSKKDSPTPVADVKPADGQVTAIEALQYATRRVPQLQLQALEEAAANQRVLRFEMAYSAGGTTGRLQTPRLGSGAITMLRCRS